MQRSTRSLTSLLCTAASVCVSLVLAWSVPPAEAQDLPQFRTIPSFALMEADDPSFSDPTFDDSSWPVVPLGAVRPDAPVFWLRARVELEPEFFDGDRPRAVRFLALASCQLFWNGELLGANGKVGDSKAEEEPGELDWLAPLPPPIASGSHAVALRCSAHHRGFDPVAGFYVFWLGDYQELSRAGRSYATRTLLSAGGLGAIGLYYVLIFAFGTRSRSHLWLGLFASAAGALVIVESVRALVGYSYDWHIVRLRAITGLTLAINYLLVLFVSRRFPIAGQSPSLRQRSPRIFVWASVSLLVLCSGVPGYDSKSALLFLVGLGASLVWTVLALASGHLDAGWAVVGLALCLGVGVWQQQAFLDYYLFFALTLLCVFLLISHILADARQRREHAAMELRTARLEIELLRRHLQPHFLMNTLTALSEWFEEEPEVAAEMVGDLGKEMRILAEVSSRRSIPLAQELELCRSHLAVMARRRDEELALEVEVVNDRIEIPPAVLHTLLENALTHNSYRAAPALFRVSQAIDGDGCTLSFEAPHRPRRGRQRSSAADGEGTGLRYVRARLRECYGDRFELVSQPVPAEGTVADAVDEVGEVGESVWRTVIRHPREPLPIEAPESLL